MKALELKIPPVVIVLVIGGLMWALARTLPVLPVAFPGRAIVAAIFGLVGLWLGASGIMTFRRIQTTVHPSTPEKASAIVSEGVYRFSRNPMYLGLALILSAWAVFLGDVVNLALVAAFIAWMTRFQIKPEERVLETKFGTTYTEYKTGVRRWL